MAKFFVSYGLTFDDEHEITRKEAINLFKKYFYLASKSPIKVFDPSCHDFILKENRDTVMEVVSFETRYNCGCELDDRWWFEENLDLSEKDIKKRVLTDFKNLSKKEEILEITLNVIHDERAPRLDMVNIKVTVNEICQNCIENVDKVAHLKQTMRPDSLLQQAIYSHGLATGFGMNEVTAEKAEENLVKFLRLSEDKEICCSWKNQQIGGFGMFVRGEVTIASNRDLWSYVGRSGEREFDVSEMEGYIIDKKSDLDFEVWDHMEFFVKTKEFMGFWAKDWFVREVPGGRELVEKLRKMGHKVYITRRRHR